MRPPLADIIIVMKTSSAGSGPAVPVVTLWHGDSDRALRFLADASVDAVVTDPPFGLTRNIDSHALLEGWLRGRRAAPGTGIAGEAWDGAVPSPGFWIALRRVLKPGGFCIVFAGARTADLMGVSLRLGGLEVIDQIAWLHGSSWLRHRRHALTGARQGATGLKAANTPVLVARRPGEGTVVQNLGRYGTGVFDLDGGAVGHRDPANVMLSHEPECDDSRCDPQCPVHRLDRQSGSLKARGNRAPTRSGGSGRHGLGPRNVTVADHGPGDAGGASRFFYASRPNLHERHLAVDDDSRDGHVAAKPVDLLRWLIRLTNPSRGTVLDPFAGSGSVLVAATAEGCNSIGIDQDERSIELATRRLAETPVDLQRRTIRSKRFPDHTDAETAAETLRNAAANLRRRERLVEEARRDRNGRVTEARAAGLTWRQIAELAGLSSPQAAERIGRL